jgi:hypothetical protein
MEIRTIRIDLGKTVFHLVVVNHGVKSWFARSARRLSCYALHRSFAHA